MESSRTRERARVPSIGRQILNHWTTEEVPLEALEIMATNISWNIYLLYTFQLFISITLILTLSLNGKHYHAHFTEESFVRVLWQMIGSTELRKFHSFGSSIPLPL